MLRERFSRWVEGWLPWYDRVAEARKARASEALARHSEAMLEEAEYILSGGEERRSNNDYLGRAYWLAAGAVERRRQ